MSSDLLKKVEKSIKNDGFKACAVRTTRFISKKMKAKLSTKEVYKDVLFVSGCDDRLPHPHRYRVSHQREQLEAYGITTNEIYYSEIDVDMVRCYHTFVFFRSSYTETIDTFIKYAKQLNKKVYYDVDDLVIDTKYTNLIPYVHTLSLEEKKAYDQGVDNMQHLLRLCDGAITSTTCLAEELREYVPAIYVNRNTASEKMVELSNDAVKQNRKTDEHVTIGYFSGSITHNADFNFILPVITSLLEHHKELCLQLVGELDLPPELEKYTNQIRTIPFGKWTSLPAAIANVDINIAPLEDTIFNAAKSENKWVEAALVGVPTVASSIGALKECITDGENGILCENLVDWDNQLELLITDKKYRDKIGRNAHDFCIEHCTTIKNGGNLANIIRENLSPNITFVLPGVEISGGVKVSLKHASVLQKKGYDVTLFILDGESKWIEFEGFQFPVIQTRTVTIDANLETAVATMWTTVKFVQEYNNISRRCYLVQNYETDFYRIGSPERIHANSTYNLKNGMTYLTISKWCKKWLEDEFKQQVQYAPNGLDVSMFLFEKRNLKGKIRILVEGDCSVDYKNVDESFRIIEQLDASQYEVWYLSYNAQPKPWYRVDKFLHKVAYTDIPNIYAQCDILLKTSLLESFSYPPLEMMATGGFVIALANGGNVEYMKDGENCLFYEQHNIEHAVSLIAQLREDEDLQNTLYKNGRETAQKRDWNQIENQIMELYCEPNERRGVF